MTEQPTPEQLLHAAYRERAHLAAWLAAKYPAVITPAPDVDEPGWQIVYITADGSQCSWHIAPRDADLFEHVERVAADDPRAQWDGHTTEEKYARIRLHTRGMGSGPECSEGHGPHLINEPGGTVEQLPADLLALLPYRSYVSTACETARGLGETALRNPDRTDELGQWRDRMHDRCRLNHKFTGTPCSCRCHQ